MRIALTASRSDNSRYKSLELDDEDDSSEDEKTINPFSIPITAPAPVLALDYSAINPFTIEANPFAAALPYEPANFQIENNPFIIPQVKTIIRIVIFIILDRASSYNSTNRIQHSKYK